MARLGPPRLVLSAQRLSVASSGLWVISRWPGEDATPVDSYVTHRPTGLHLAVRRLADFVPSDAITFEEHCEGYAEIAWPELSRTHEVWTAGALRGLSFVFEDARDARVIREWYVTDGRGVANLATFASEEEWAMLLADCEALVRTVEFG